jgi:hypothetical protein
MASHVARVVRWVSSDDRLQKSIVYVQVVSRHGFFAVHVQKVRTLKVTYFGAA